MNIDISREDVLAFIDQDELKESIKYEIKAAIRQEALSILKKEDTIKGIVKEMISEIIKEDVVFSREFKTDVKKKIEDVLGDISNWDVSYAAGFDGVIKEVANKDKELIESILKVKVLKAAEDTEISSYRYEIIITDILQKYIMESTEGIDLRESVKTFVSSGIERVLERLAE